MSDLVFVDTNVLVYALDDSEMDKHDRCHQWLEFLWARQSGRLSVQVLQEFYSVLRHSRRIEHAAARENVRAYWAWNPIAIDSNVSDSAWRIESRYGISWWDALIVAAAAEAHCNTLLTEDLQHGQLFDSVQVVNPFLAEPAAALAD